VAVCTSINRLIVKKCILNLKNNKCAGSAQNNLDVAIVTLHWKNGNETALFFFDSFEI
jgi:hypothetical protein